MKRWSKKKDYDLRYLGILDARQGKPIENFYNLPLDRHTENFRASYEIGYRWAKQELRRTKEAK